MHARTRHLGGLVGALLLTLATGARGAGGCAWLEERLDWWPVPDRLQARSPARWWRTARFERPCRELKRCLTDEWSSTDECLAELRTGLEAECDAAYSGFAEGRARERCALAVPLVMESVSRVAPRLGRDARYEARHLDHEHPGRAVRRSVKWRVDHRAPALRVPTRWQPAGPAKADDTGAVRGEGALP